MQTPTTSELAARLVDAVASYLDDDEHRVLGMALGSTSSQRTITAMLTIAKDKHCVLPADLEQDLSDWRAARNRRIRPVSFQRTA